MHGGFDLNAWTAADVATEQHPTSTLSASSYSSQVVSQSLDQPQNRGPTHRVGDWTCNECHNVNFAKRTRCNKCGARREEEDDTSNSLDETPHYGGPPGLFKKGDWACTHCGNVNWARRTKCNVCNSPKPNQDDAPRTGRGGGHFDLQDPEDRLSHDSEDEDYDEFGRKKKKRRKVPPSASKPVKASIVQSQAPDDELRLGESSSTIVTKLYFPPPPACYVRGRTRSIASVSSTSSDYEEILDDD